MHARHRSRSPPRNGMYFFSFSVRTNVLFLTFFHRTIRCQNGICSKTRYFFPCLLALLITTIYSFFHRTGSQDRQEAPSTTVGGQQRCRHKKTYNRETSPLSSWNSRSSWNQTLSTIDRVAYPQTSFPTTCSWDCAGIQGGRWLFFCFACGLFLSLSPSCSLLSSSARPPLPILRHHGTPGGRRGLSRRGIRRLQSCCYPCEACHYPAEGPCFGTEIERREYEGFLNRCFMSLLFHSPCVVVGVLLLV